MNGREELPREIVFPGLVGKVIETFSPYTEADPFAIAAQFIVGFGNALGRGPRFYVGETPHHTNESLAIVGRSSRARKGDGCNVALRALRDADPEWASNIASGLSSGEGLIYHVRDAVKAPAEDGTERIVDPGVEDKRLLVVESEFATALKQLDRKGNILSPVLRDCWDAKPVLRTLTRNHPMRATDALVSLIVHTTPEDLHAHLAEVEAANGLGNRFLFLETDRRGLLPNPGRAPAYQVDVLIRKTRAVLDAARQRREVQRTPEANALYERIYPDLSRDYPGLVGSLLARAEAHVVRLSLLFSLISQSPGIGVEHLESALAWWGIFEESIRRVFGGRSGNKDADRIQEGMLPGQSLTFTEVREELFKGHLSAGRLAAAIDLLCGLGGFRVEERPTDGRPAQVLTRLEKEEKPEKPPFSSFSSFSSRVAT